MVARSGVLPENRCAKVRPPLEFELVAATVPSYFIFETVYIFKETKEFIYWNEVFYFIFLLDLFHEIMSAIFVILFRKSKFTTHA